MKYGKKPLNKLTEEQKSIILESIISDCIEYAGDSYSDFARPVISLLVKNKLVEYGE
jgi:hypothetical protein